MASKDLLTVHLRLERLALAYYFYVLFKYLLGKRLAKWVAWRYVIRVTADGRKLRMV